MARSHPAARDVRIVVHELASIEAWVDAKKLGRAVYNLVLNACQAARRGKAQSPRHPRVAEDNESIRIEVSDNGPGVAESIRKTMFLPFVSEGKESGVGLGLTLAQQIAQEHGGSIELKETPRGLERLHHHSAQSRAACAGRRRGQKGFTASRITNDTPVAVRQGESV